MKYSSSESSLSECGSERNDKEVDQLHRDFITDFTRKGRGGGSRPEMPKQAQRQAAGNCSVEQDEQREGNLVELTACDRAGN